MEDDNMLLEYEWADVHSYLMLREDLKCKWKKGGTDDEKRDI